MPEGSNLVSEMGRRKPFLKEAVSGARVVLSVSA